MAAVLLAAASDLAVGGVPVHIATLGVVIAMVSAVRLHLAGSRRGLLSVVSGCVVAQPALRICGETVPHSLAGPGIGWQIGHVDLVVTVIQLTVALAIVTTVSFTEQIVAGVSGIVRVDRLRIRPPAPQTRVSLSRVRRAPAPGRLTSRYCPGVIARRGPPRRLAPAV